MANAEVIRGTQLAERRLLLVIALAGAGLAVSAVIQAVTSVQIRVLANSFLYGRLTSALLTVGLFAAAYGISRLELRRNARVVLVAITLGVALKAGLVGGVMALAYKSTGFLLLGIAVAQIDPLSVAATLRHSDMSQRARSILSAWASFDDPVTVLLVYAGLFALPLARHAGRGSLGPSVGGYLSQIVLNATLIAVAAVAWYLLDVSRRGRPGAVRRYALQCVMLAALLTVAAWYGLLIGITVCGLFFRPPVTAVIERAVDFAFYGATLLLGLLLVEGVNVLAGILLGVSVIVIQVLAALAISSGLPRDDRVYLALGQQNGLTAIVLGLALQPYVPQAVGIIAVAILVVNVINIYSNRIWDLKLQAAAATGLTMEHKSRSVSKPSPRLTRVVGKRENDVVLTAEGRLLRWPHPSGSDIVKGSEH